MKTDKSVLSNSVLVAVLLACLPAWACNGDGGTRPEEGPMAEYAGTWTATKAAVTATESPLISFDVVAFGGALTWTVRPQGDFTGSAAIPGLLLGLPEMGMVTIPLTGVMRRLDGLTIQIEFTPEMPPLFHTMEPTLTRMGTNLTLTEDDGWFDFNNDGVLERRSFLGTFILK